LISLRSTANATHRKNLRTTGLMTIKAELVRTIGLQWGGDTDGDLMHFDSRNLPLGRRLLAAIRSFKQNVATHETMSAHWIAEGRDDRLSAAFAAEFGNPPLQRGNP
jgi:hypothetical protein